MALNFNIPMPDLPGTALMKGLQTGGDLYSKYMQPIIQREQIAQQQRDLAERGQYHQGSLEQNKAHLEQQWKQHLQDLALRQQAESRMQSMAPYQKQLAQLRMQNLINKNDPNRAMEQFTNFYNQTVGNQPEEKPKESYIPSIMGQQQGAIPESRPLEDKKNPGVDMEKIKKSPILRAAFKHSFGVDPGSIKEPTEKDKALTEYAQKRAESFAYSTAPVDTKNYMLAQAAGMGIAPDKAVNAFTKGKTLEDLAKENGFDPENMPEPDFAPTKGNITKLNERKAALGEMKHLSDFVIKGLGPYSETVMGWSPQQTWSQLNGMDKNKQIKFLAARAIVPELTNMRLMTAGAKNTVHGIKSLQDKSLMNIKGLQSGVSPDVWMAAQKLVDKELEQAMKASMSKFRLKTKNERMAESEEISNPNSKELTYNVETGDFE